MKAAGSGAVSSKGSITKTVLASGPDAERRRWAGRRIRKDVEARPGIEGEEEAEDLEQRNEWAAPERRDLKALILHRKFHMRDFALGPAVGRGTFATVRPATPKHFEERDEVPWMAMKIMKKAQLLMTQQVAHVKAEKEILQLLDSAFIPMFLASFQDERRVFFLMEYIHGGELYHRLRREGRLPVDHSKFYTAEIVLALHYLHSVSVAYRDLKPENVMFDWQGHIKLTDFGFAKIMKEDELATTLVGAPEYMAPEVIQAVGHGMPVDMWALGVLIFEMTAGFPPFSDKTPFGIYTKILAADPRYPRHFDVKAVDLIRQLLVPAPAKRLDTIGCVAHIWFDHVEWMQMQQQVVAPPWFPNLRSPTDYSCCNPLSDEEAFDHFDNCLPITRKDNAAFAAF